jgi:hypothetical protein
MAEMDLSYRGYLGTLAPALQQGLILLGGQIECSIEVGAPLAGSQILCLRRQRAMLAWWTGQEDRGHSAAVPRALEREYWGYSSNAVIVLSSSNILKSGKTPGPCGPRHLPPP